MVGLTNYMLFGAREYGVMMTMTLTKILVTGKPCLTSGDKSICVQSFGALCNAGLVVSE